MNPTQYEQPGLRLPEPLTEGEQVSTPRQPERAPAASPETAAGQQLPPIPMMPAGPAVNPLATAVPVPPVRPTNSSVPSAADDADLIEKEWVAKAKAIVEQTKEDPYKQTREMNYFKADYMKKRYNKDVKVSEH